mgnify:CR=1 FL=1
MSRSAAAHQRYEDDMAERAEHIERQVMHLMDAENSRAVSFTSFSDDACELLGDHADEVLQLVLAAYMGKTELADKLSDRLGAMLADLAERMVERELDK